MSLTRSKQLRTENRLVRTFVCAVVEVNGQMGLKEFASGLQGWIWGQDVDMQLHPT